MKKILSILVVLALVRTCAPFAASAKADFTQPAGEGTAEAPYRIGTAAELYWFAALVNGDTEAVPGIVQNTAAHAVLTADIVVNENVLKEDGTLNDGSFRPWTPIGEGNIDIRYQGIFDGGGFTVKGLYFSDESAFYVGLIGRGENSTIQNVTVADSYLRGYRYVGGVAGYNNGAVTNCHNAGTVIVANNAGGVVGYLGIGGTATNCHNTGTVTGTDGATQTGGVAGYISSNGTATNCYNTGTVTGTDYVGGVAGENLGTATNCYNTGTVTGSEWYIGGVAGDNRGIVTNCHNAGAVTGTKYVGGVAGRNYRAESGIADCYNIGAVTGTNDVGGVVGLNNGSSITDCYNIGAVTGSGDDIGGVTGYSNREAKNCYYLDTCGAEGKGTAKDAEAFASGEVAYLLGEPFGQTIGVEEYPVLDGAKVYPVQNCRNEPAGYANTEQTGPAHSYELATGICTACGAVCAHESYTDGVCDACGKLDLQLAIDSISLRSNCAGVYYGATFRIPEGVEVARQGIVVSLYNQLPVADGTDDSCLWTTGTTSVVISDILEEGAGYSANKLRAAMPIYARAYLELADGTYIYSDAVGMHLQQVTEAVDAVWNDLEEPQITDLTAMYGKFEKILRNWNLPNTKANAQ